MFSIFRKKNRQPLCAAVVAAAGSSSRMGEDKMLLDLGGGESVILRAVRALERSDSIHEVVVVTREELVVPVAQLLREGGCAKVTSVIRGGATRTESVSLGVKAVTCAPKLIAIHDGARPLVPLAVIDGAIRRAEKTGAAAPALPVKDTLKEAVDGVAERTLDRAGLFAVQTPQVFDADLISAALTKALAEGAELTDDCAAVERMGMKVSLTEGSEANFKLTTPADVLLARGVLAIRGEQV